MKTIMKVVCFILLLSVVNAIEINHKTQGTDFVYKDGSGQWKSFGKFAGVNLGVTSPGYQPGEVILKREDYLNRFTLLELMGIKVIRVYALLHPEFYQTLMEWNQNNFHKLYVLHGTSFPEHEMEGENGEGNDVYQNNITELMKYKIHNTITAVYGKGNVTYKWIRGVIPVTGNYNVNIAPYLLGWVVGGEVWPYAINKTIDNNKNRPLYDGKYISAVPDANIFESWIAEILDYTANVSVSYGHAAPISHTNWVTTDGISNPTEPRFPDSIEDMVEMDMTHLYAKNWSAGIFYNQHIYPYYPQLVKTSETNTSTEDPYYAYVDRIKQHHNDKPFIVTEVGLPTSVGIASRENYLNRNHGHVNEAEQGRLMKDIILNLIQSHGMNGVIVFQLLDEWFKKSWNQRKFETNRHHWHNPLSAEQSFGIFKVDPFIDHKTEDYIPDKYINRISVSHNEMYFKVKINHDNLVSGNIIVGIDSMRSGTYKISNLGISKRFSHPIDHVLIINVNTGKVNFYQLGIHNDFVRHYGEWLSQTDGYPLQDNIFDILNPENGLFYKFQQLTRVPLYVVRNGTKEYYSHERFTLEFLERSLHNNLGLFNKPDANTFEIDIPWGLLGYTDPSSHQKYILSESGNKFVVNYVTDKSPINLDISYNIGEAEFSESRRVIEYIWDNWEIPRSYQVKPKAGLEDFRIAFHTANGLAYNPLPSDIVDKMGWTYVLPERPTEESNDSDYTIHQMIVLCAFVFLAFVYFYASIGQFILSKIGPWRTCVALENKVEGSSERLRWISLLVLGGMVTIYLFGIRQSEVEVTGLYILVLVMLVWDYLIILICLLFAKLDVFKTYDDGFVANPKEHAFVIACHNSSSVIRGTLESLLLEVPPGSIYVADNGSNKDEQKATRTICQEETDKYYREHPNYSHEINGSVHYGHYSKGNKTIAQYASVISYNMDDNVKFVTCVDDDTRLDKSWKLDKVIRYFNDPEVAVLAYPLKVHNPKYEIEYFQAVEYTLVGIVKMFHSKMRSTIFNSGAFGTYRVEVLREAFQYHNTDFNGDDLQICLNIHQLKGKDYITIPGKKHTTNYRVTTASDMIIPTIVPQCWIHGRSVSRSCFTKPCTCDNPDLFAQRVKGWAVSKHRFVPKMLYAIINWKGVKGIWVRLVLLYEVLLVLLEYINIILTIILIRYVGMWLVEVIIIGLALNILTLIIFNYKVLKSNNINLPFEVIATQPLIYKLFVILIYKQLGLWYNLLIYTPTHKTGTEIRKRSEDPEFIEDLRKMYSIETRPPAVIPRLDHLVITLDSSDYTDDSDDDIEGQPPLRGSLGSDYSEIIAKQRTKPSPFSNKRYNVDSPSSVSRHSVESALDWDL